MKNVCSIRVDGRRRGSVMILVVAVLGLLAVIGTVYIVSSRAQRSTSAALSTSVNLNLARLAVMNQVQQTIGNSMIDSAGAIGGYDKTTATYGTRASRNFDYPEPGDTTSAANFGQTTYNTSMQSEPWLVAKLHRQAATDTDLTQITYKPFDPSAGTYTAPWATFSATASTDTIVCDQTTSDTTTDDAPKIVPDAYINLLPFSDQAGSRYRFGLRILDTSRMANLNTGSVDDSVATGSRSDTTGTYLTAMRLAPGSGAAFTAVLPTPNAYFQSGDNATVTLLHKNTGAMGGLGRALSTSANAIFNVASWEAQVLRIEQPSDTSLAFFDLSDELDLRSYGEYGTTYRSRPTVGWSGTYKTWPVTLNANPGAPTVNNITGNPSRRNYTTYSFSRELRAYPDPATIYTLTPSGDATNGYVTLPQNVTGAIWPTSPAGAAYARVAADPVVDVVTSVNTRNDAMYYIAMAATNMATAMESCSGGAAISATNVFTHEEAVAFAANYMTGRWNGFCADTAIVGATGGAYYLPNGPSFVDGMGLCFRTATWGGTAAAPTGITGMGRDFAGAGNLTTATLGANKVSLGYAAQPFINEIAVYEDQDTTLGTPGTPNYADAAVELYNPYPIALSLRGFHLIFGTLDIDLTTNDSGNPAFIPANGYYLVFGNGGHFSALATLPAVSGATGGFQKSTPTTTPLVLVAGMTNAVLYRPYCKRTNTTPSDLAAIDSMDLVAVLNVTGLPDVATGGILTEETVQRNNDQTTVAGANLWGASVAVAVSRTAGQTLGLPNTPYNPGGYPLADRFNQGTPAVQGSAMGMGELSRTIRLANEFDTTAIPAIPSNTVSMHLGGLTAATLPYNTMSSPLEPQIRFDFYGDPSIYSTSPPTDVPGTHDIRAIRFLDEVALIDRVSDYSNTVNNVAGVDIQKIRLPGQINVNTASGDVLRAIPNMTDQMVANILAYRGRDNPVGATGNATYNGMASASYAPGTYPGHGIRSLAELIVPLAGVTPPARVSPLQYPAGSMDSRDEAWGNIYNLCTVRSDTFAVYGYLEAVKQNPTYAGFNNGTDWYTSSTAAVYTASLPIDDSHNVGPLIRVARRRWIAIVDRSFSNYARTSANFSLPRVVAIKDLPQ